MEQAKRYQPSENQKRELVTNISFVDARCFHELFTAQAAHTPNAIAVTFQDQSLTYQELEERANQLGHYLQELGVMPDQLVGIYVERTPEMIVAALAVWKAGAAFLPLDTAYPTDRLAYMLADSGLSIVLTQEPFANVPTLVDCTLFCLDRDWGSITHFPTTPPTSAVTADHLAYVIYTSGSTGRPKGVLITHRGLYNLANVQEAIFQLTPADRMLQFASFSFDAAILEIVAALRVGATICLGSREELMVGQLLLDFLQKNQITTAFMVPSVLASLPQSDLPQLRLLLVGGEAVTPDLVSSWSPHRRLLNLYGPTEITIWTTFFDCSHTSAEVPPIGQPIANSEVYVLDEDLQRVPNGVPGELYVATVGLARGYLHRPRITAEKFIPHPFHSEPGARLYCTGDRARFRPDGNLEFLGRIDHQVKVRGYRIELGEIEARLQQHTAVSQALVIAQTKETQQDKQIVAYLVTKAALPDNEWRQWVQQTLPDYMVPSAFVLLDEFPLTPNGKIDRKALPVPQYQGIADDFTAPQTPIEEMLATLWAGLLEIPQVSVHDNFFALGAHSLQATQVITRLNQQFHTTLTLSDFFQNPTIRQLGAKLQAYRGTAPPIPAIVRRPSSFSHYPLSFAQERLWFLAQLTPDNTAYNEYFAIRLHGILNVKALEQAINEIVQRHELLRTVFQHEQGRPTAVVHSTYIQPLPQKDLSTLDTAVRDKHLHDLLRQHANTTFDISSLPLFSTQLFKLNDMEHILSLNMHHIITDGWSIGIFARELAILYESLDQKRPITLPSLPIQYSDFAQWQQEWIQGDVLQTLLAYWKNKLKPIAPPLNLPTTPITASPQAPTGSQYLFTLDTALTQQLRGFSYQHDVTLFITLISAFHAFLYLTTGQERINVGIPIANRTRPEIENLIGFFVNTLVLVAEFKPEMTFRHLLQQMSGTVLEAYDHQELPFNKLVEALQSGRDAHKQPLFDVLFVLQNATGRTQGPPDLQFDLLPIYEGSAKFPLTLIIQERGNELTCALEYNTFLFIPETITQLAANFQHLLYKALADPNCAIVQIDLPIIERPVQAANAASAQTSQTDKAQPEDVRAKVETARTRITDKRSQLSDKKQALLAKLLGKPPQRSTRQTIPLRPPDEPALLSFSQERLWFLDQLEPGLTVYNIPFKIELNGPLDVEALEQSFSQVVARHEVLRTVYHSDGKHPIQVILPPKPITMEKVDLQNLSEAAQETAVTQHMTTHAQTIFNLQDGPILAVRLLCLTPIHHLLLFTIHHIAFDGWSASVFMQEIGRCYAAATMSTPPLPSLSIQYADFAHWQRHWLQGEILEKHLAYWQEHLGGELPLLALPIDYPRPKIQTFVGHTHVRSVPIALIQALKAVGQQEDATLFMVLLAAFQVLLHRYTGQEDIIVGTPIANRIRSELEPLIGFFVNTLALRADLSGNPSFIAFLRHVKNITQDAYAHQGLPFEKLVKVLQPQRDLSRTPVFQVMIGLQNTPMQPTTNKVESALSINLLPVMAYDTARFDLDLSIQEKGDYLECLWEYNTDLFAAETIDRMHRHFCSLLENIVANPQQSISHLALLRESERQELITDWNQTWFPYSTDEMLHTLFAAQAARTPTATALSFAGQTLSYGELNMRANRLAHHLQILGVTAESFVGLFMERTPEMVIGLLAILKAGGAYVPLDPTYPADRVEYTLTDAQAQIVLTHSALMAQLQTAVSLPHILPLDTLVDTLLTYPPTNPTTTTTSAHLAYLIYTSGSTGKPKGVAITHRNAIAMLSWAIDTFPPDVLSHVAAVTSICFDLSVYELFLPLAVGGTIVLAANALQIPQLPERDQITLINTVPSAMTELVRTQAIPHNVRVINLAGEPLKRALVQQIYQTSQVQQVYNLYGPSEDTTYSTGVLISRDDPREPTIGRPIANTQAYILDRHFQPTPIGVPGELFLGGDGVSRGYLRRPGLTASRYLPDPFSSTPGGRMYKTGDLTRYLPNAHIEYLGRTDFQVKVRGYRIELGEVEAVLSRHEAVHMVVVVASDAADGNKQLVAYLVTDEPAPDTAALRSFLSETLPDFMIPAAFVMLPQMPLTPNGKINRKALPRPTFNEASASFFAPRTHTETQLATIWSELLGLERIGIHDNFFEMGGHSLLATQVVSRIRRELDVDLPLRQVFEFPTLATLAAAVDKTAVSSTTETAHIVHPTIPLAARDAPLPLSFAQERLWFLDQLVPNSPAYNIPIPMRLHGPLDVPVLTQSLQEIIHRHESLRTTFALVDDSPVQVIHDPHSLPFSLHTIDLRHLLPEQQQAELLNLVASDAQTPFNLAAGPLLRTALVILAEQDHALLCNMHHIVSDGWSISRLIAELSSLYTAFAVNQPFLLPELPIQYADFAAWQRDWLQGDVLEQHVAYWRDQFAQLPPPLQLPTDYPRPAVNRHHGASYPFSLPRALVHPLNQLSQAHSSTLFMTLLAAFKVLLYRYSTQNQIVVGSPIANRNRLELEPLIGFFVNTLALQTNLGGDPSFLDLLHRVRETTLGAYAHQDLPFEKLVQILQPQRDLSTTPIFQVMFVLQNIPAFPAIGDDSIRVELILSDVHTTKFDLTLTLLETADSLSGSWEYDTDLFAPETIQRLHEHFCMLLTAVIANPTQHISQLPMLTEQEQKQLRTWNATQTLLPHIYCGHDLFAAQVARTPDAIAVTFQEERLTYRELDERANQLAHYLQGLGVKPDQLVGIYLERSLEMIIAALGVWKAGAAFLPLDTAYPADRLNYMLTDSAVSVILTQQALTDVSSLIGRIIVDLDRDWAVIAAAPQTAPTSSVTPAHLAYIIYTSGSTGRPKGVMLTHAGLFNLSQAQESVFQLNQTDRVVQLASFSFDAAVLEITAALFSGATLCLGTRAALMPGTPLLDFLQKQQITAGLIIPSTLSSLPDAPLPHLRLLLVGGEAATPDLITRWSPGRQLINLYGPTEITIWTTKFVCPDTADGPPPIGRPIRNTEIYILDAHQQMVPVGVPGELCISTVGLARGYLNRPRITAEKFIPHPYSSESGARLYRSGDLARFRPDGNIEFLGRIDHQVKVRGYRIELNEIEALLSQHPALGSVVVHVQPAPGESKQVVAYVVPRTETLDTAVLRDYLAQALPDYMIPAAFVPLTALPLTPGGKVDRQALPQPGDFALGTLYTAPRTTTEAALAAIWAELTQREQVGIYDNFFELGGHSLLATQVIARIRRDLDVEMPLRQLFELPTVAALANALDQVTNAVQLPPIYPVDRQHPLPLSFAQQRLWFLDQIEENNTSYNVPIPIHLRGKLDVQILEKSLQTVIARHEVLRTTFTMIEGEVVQMIHDVDERPFHLQTCDLQHLPTRERDATLHQLGQVDAQTPFNLSQGPLLRVTFVVLAPNEYALLLNIHHIICDEWSTRILVGEVVTLYDTFLHHKPSSLPELPAQYADYAVWQRNWLAGAEFERQLAYWQGKLRDLPVLEMPTDKPRPPLMTFRGDTASFTLPPELLQAAKAACQAEGVTLFMFMMTVFKLLLARYSNTTDIVLGSPIANRPLADMQNMVGIFLNTLVFRTDIAGMDNFHQAFAQVRQTCLEAYAHQDLPFEELVNALQPARDMSRTPLFQVMFVLTHETMTASTSEITVTPLTVNTGTAKFDLTLFLNETAKGMTGTLEYSTDLFHQDTIHRLWGHFVTLLTAVLQNPDHPLAMLPLLTPAENQQITQWNQTHVQYPYTGPVHYLFMQQAERTPEAVAVEWGEHSLTYRELDTRTNQLAHYLQAAGIGPDIPVAIGLERSLEMVIAILGTLKAGGAYLPLDPSYPTERLSFMLTDSQAPMLLTQASLRETFSAHTESTVCLDTEWETIASWPQTAVSPSATADNLLYLIYTSGSTGKPKGVAMCHESLTNLVQWQMSHTALPHSARILQFSPISFDVSCQEIFFTWHSGGTLVLVDDATRRDAIALLDFLQVQQIERLFLPFIALQHLAEVANARDIHGFALREIITAGEQLQVTPAITSFCTALDCTLHNQYGPTESHVATAYTLSGSPNTWAALPPVGIPVANATIEILDDHQQRVPIGVSGELHIGGRVLARGYLNRPSLTAQKFIPNPFLKEARGGDEETILHAAHSMPRLYKTGDLARYLPDGNIEYLGRNDFQVKVRGYRIEPGEIETALGQHPDVRNVVVRAWADSGGQKRLVAYIVAAATADSTTLTTQLQAFLHEQMPAYMVPERWLLLDQFPTTPSGKIDRRALPQPDLVQRQVDELFMPPRDALEMQLAHIWQEVLSVYPIGIHDNFFDLGGHSLLAVRLLTQMQSLTTSKLPLTLLFQNVTIAQLAAFLRQEGTTLSSSPLVPIRPTGTKQPLFCVHPGGGSVLPYVEWAQHLDGERPFYGLQSVGIHGDIPLHTTVTEMATSYIAAIKTVQPQGPYLLGGWSMGGIVAYEMARQLQDQGDSVAQVILVDSSTPNPLVNTMALDETTYLAYFAQDMGLTLSDLDANLSDFDQQMAHLINAAKMRQLLPENVDTEQVAHLYHLFQTNYAAMLNYQPRPYAGQVIIFKAAEQIAQSQTDITGWQQWTQVTAIQEVPGNHFTMVRQPHVHKLVHLINRCLDEIHMNRES